MNTRSQYLRGCHSECTYFAYLNLRHWMYVVRISVTTTVNERISIPVPTALKARNVTFLTWRLPVISIPHPSSPLTTSAITRWTRWFRCHLGPLRSPCFWVPFLFTHKHMSKFFPPPMSPHILCGFRGPPFWAWQECNRLLRLGRPWGAVTLSRWRVWVVIEGDVVPGGALNLNSTNLPRPWSPRESSPSRKIPSVEPGNEPGTSWLVVRDSDN